MNGFNSIRNPLRKARKFGEPTEIAEFLLLYADAV